MSHDQAKICLAGQHDQQQSKNYYSLCPAVTTTVSLLINFPTLLDRNNKQWVSNIYWTIQHHLSWYPVLMESQNR